MRPSAVRITATYLLGVAFTSIGIITQAQRSHIPLNKAYRRWDSGFYVSVAQHGYNLFFVTPSGYLKQNTTAFFPGYPLAIRLLANLFGWAGLSYRGAAWAINGGCGLAALFVIAATVRHFYPEPIAVRTAQAVALFPGAAVLLFTYAEGLFLLLATTCVYAAVTRRWWWAGLAALAAGGTRANGLYLAVFLGLVALHAIWTRRDWLSLVAPALAPLGFAAYLGFVWWETGRPDEWFAVERYGWRQRNDFGAETFRVLTGPHPLDSGLLVLQLVGVGFVVLIGVLALVRRTRLPGTLLTYTAVMLLPLLVASRVGLRPRFLLPAFPLMVVAAQALRSWAFAAYCALCLVGLVWSGYVYVGHFPP
ncbi:hypothetical protein acdb102_34000 [Acidothermaceae bacterium B102]|nr:hypothetical protein acdb102_34000 [Acidothermaceae bacterium B102]